MERILEQLYKGDLCPADNCQVENPDYRRLCNANLEETDRFANSLAEERREAFDVLMDHYLEVSFMEKTQAFTAVSYTHLPAHLTLRLPRSRWMPPPGGRRKPRMPQQS